MTSFKLKFAVMAALGALASPSFAAWEALPVTGFTAVAGTGQPTGGTTPYKICNPNGNFGSQITFADSAVCKSPVATTSLNTAPETGFTLIGSSTGSLVVNNTYSSGSPVTVGNYHIRMFRKAATNECIFAAQGVLINADYYTNNAEAVSDGLPNANGTQTYEINDVAMGGYLNSGTVNASYSNLNSTGETVFRVGRTYTSVQHRATVSVDGATPAPGYYNLPLSSGTSYLATITGREAKDCCTTNPTLAQQSANLNANWVDFTTDANWKDPDGGSKPATSAVYVKASCSSDGTAPSTTPTANATRFRLSWQEQSNTYPQAFIELRVPGFVPKGANALPSPTAAPF